MSSSEAITVTAGVDSSEGDRRLALAAAGGDPRAFAALFEAHRHAVYRIARAVTGDHETAKDAVQETFIKVHAALARFRGESSFRTWIARIAVRAAIDERRREARHPAAWPSGRDPADDPRGRIESVLALQRVQELAGRIGGQQGLILRLRLLGELSNQEVAEALGLREANVRMQLSKAIRRLREML